MKIGIIGAGRVGVSFGKILDEHNLLSGFYSDAYPPFAYPVFENGQELCKKSDVIFITVPDGKITEVWNSIKEICTDKIVCHMSGAVSAEEALPQGVKTASLHPMMAVSSIYSSEELKRAQFTLEGSGADEIKEILSFLNIRQIASDKKTLYHASCVFASNLMQAVMAISMENLTECGFSEDEALHALEKLTCTNIENIFSEGIGKSLTGPIDRGDIETVKKHLGVLKGKDKEIYKMLSEKLTWIAEEKHKKDYSRLRKELNR